MVWRPSNIGPGPTGLSASAAAAAGCAAPDLDFGRGKEASPGKAGSAAGACARAFEEGVAAIGDGAPPKVRCKGSSSGCLDVFRAGLRGGGAASLDLLGEGGLAERRLETEVESRTMLLPGLIGLMGLVGSSKSGEQGNAGDSVSFGFGVGAAGTLSPRSWAAPVRHERGRSAAVGATGTLAERGAPTPGCGFQRLEKKGSGSS